MANKRRWFRLGSGVAVGVTTLLGLFWFLTIQYGFIITEMCRNL